MGEVRDGDQNVRKYLFSETFYGRQAVSYEDFFSRIIWVRGVKTFPRKISSGAQSKDLEQSLTIQELFSKNTPGFICSVCVSFLGSYPVTTEGIRVSWTTYFVVREEGMGWGGKTLMEA